MRVTESIAELKQICQESREDKFFHLTLGDKLVGEVSIYLTKLFLEIGISANQATFIGLIVGVTGAAFFVFPSPKYWFIGIALTGLFIILRRVDGGIARYNKTASPKGAFWNSMAEAIVSLCTLTCISFGLYYSVHSIYPFVFGFLRLTTVYLGNVASLLPYRVLHQKGLLSGALVTDETAAAERHPSMIIRYGRFFTDIHTGLLALLICTVVDFFIAPFAIGSLFFNARYIWFIMRTLLALAATFRGIYFPLRGGVKLKP